MTDNRIDAAVASDLTSAMTEFSVGTQSTDGAGEGKETIWMNRDWTQDLGYYKDKKTPEITAVIDAKARFVVGEGFIADEITTMRLDAIRGNGFDTFNSILENAERTLLLGGNFYAEIIVDEEENFINLKPLDPEVIQHVVDEQGMFLRFEQVSKVPGKKPRKIPIDRMFYLARNRIADEIHGTGIASKLKLIIDMKNEAMEDQRQLMHWNVKPRWKFKLKTDDETEIAAYKAKMDAATGTGENMYEPFDTAESELIAVPPNATLNPIPWIQYLDNLFYEVGGVPKIIIGGTGGFTEQAVTITYLSFQQSISGEQLYIEEQVLSQLNIEIKLTPPISVENNLLTDKEKDGDMNIDSSETTAGENVDREPTGEGVT